MIVEWKRSDGAMESAIEVSGQNTQTHTYTDKSNKKKKKLKTKNQKTKTKKRRKNIWMSRCGQPLSTRPGV
jgi:hypothetical protein